VKSGESALGTSEDYLSTLVKGNRSAMLGAVSPEASVAAQQSDAAKRQRASMGTARGGGTSAAGERDDTKLRSTIDNALFGLRTKAAGALGSEGAASAGLGIESGNMAGTAASNLTSDSIDSRKVSYAINRQTQQDVVNAAMAALNL
jgi:hypothetical protein